MKANKKNLMLAMARACMNASDIAQKSSMPLPSVKNVIYGRNVNPRTFGLVASALHVDPLEIIEGE